MNSHTLSQRDNNIVCMIFTIIQENEIKHLILMSAISSHKSSNRESPAYTTLVTANHRKCQLGFLTSKALEIITTIHSHKTGFSSTALSGYSMQSTRSFFVGDENEISGVASNDRNGQDPRQFTELSLVLSAPPWGAGDHEIKGYCKLRIQGTMQWRLDFKYSLKVRLSAALVSGRTPLH